MGQATRDRVNSRHVRTHEKNSEDAVRRWGTIIETLRYPEIGVRVTGSATFFSFCGDVIDLTR